MKRLPTQKFQRYDLVQMKEKIPWLYKVTAEGNECVSFYDWSGKQGVVVGSYYDQFGGGKAERAIYTICFPGMGECSWCDEATMTLIEENRPDLMKLWGSRSTRRG